MSMATISIAPTPLLKNISWSQQERFLHITSGFFALKVDRRFVLMHVKVSPLANVPIIKFSMKPNLSIIIT